MRTLKQRYDKLVVKAKGRKKAIKQLNSFVKYMRKNDTLLTAENANLHTIIAQLNKENLALVTKLEHQETLVGA